MLGKYSSPNGFKRGKARRVQLMLSVSLTGTNTSSQKMRHDTFRSLKRFHTVGASKSPYAYGVELLICPSDVPQARKARLGLVCVGADENHMSLLANARASPHNTGSWSGVYVSMIFSSDGKSFFFGSVNIRA